MYFVGRKLYFVVVSSATPIICAYLFGMADLELHLTRSLRPTRSQEISPETRLHPTSFYSDNEERGARTPPPDYENFFSDDLPSTRIKHRQENYVSYGSTRDRSNNYIRNDMEIENSDSETILSSSSHTRSTAFDTNANSNDDDNDHDDDDEPSERRKKRIKAYCKKAFNISRISAMTALTLVSIMFFALNDELEENYVLMSVNSSSPIYYEPSREEHAPQWYGVRLHIRGPFYDLEYAGGYNYSRKNMADNPFDQELGDATNCSNFLVICLTNDTGLIRKSACEILDSDVEHSNYYENHCTSVQLINNTEKLQSGEHNDDHVIKRTLPAEINSNITLNFLVSTNFNIQFEFAVIGEILHRAGQIILAGVILVIVYIFIVFDLVHRTVAAIIGSTIVLGVLSMLHKRPTLETAVEWLSLETICLLFGMMILVAIFSQTGFFDYFAVKCYKLSRGKVWPLICLLCLFSGVVSAFLDNVTTILLLIPVSIRLCQVLNLDPVPILIAEVLFSNIGGTATAIGDPPNVIIVSNEFIISKGVNFAEFTLHLFIGIIFCMVTGYIVLALFYYIMYVGRRDSDPPHIAELKREIAIWERTARYMPVVSLEERAVREALRTKARDVRNQLKEQKSMSLRTAANHWRKNLAELENRYKITDKVLLVKSSIVLLVVIVIFFTSHFIPFIELNLGWIAIFGALMLLLLADVQEIETVLHKVEWGTLLFFAGLFVLMEGLGELGLMDFIGEVTIDIIKMVDEEYQLLVAIILVLWVSAIVSSFIDNIPFTQAMIPVIIKLADSPEICLPAKPLIWTLAFGACLGGNGTLIGASANVVCAGIAEQNGYKISFNSFFKMGFPMMIATTFTVMIYLIICHVLIGWDVNEC